MAKQKQRRAESSLLDDLVDVDRSVHGAVSAEDTNPWRERARMHQLREAAYLGNDRAWEAIRDRLTPADRRLIEAKRAMPRQSARIELMKERYSAGAAPMLPGAAGRIIEGGFTSALHSVEQALAFGMELGETLPVLGASETRQQAAAERRRELAEWAEAHEMALDALAEEGTDRSVTDTFSRPWIEKRLRGAVRSLGQVTISGHPAVAIAGFSASEAASAATEADRRGLTGDDRAAYIAGQATIEATPATVMSLLGFSGGEQIAAYPLRRLMTEMIAEIGEELTTEVAHELFRRYSMDELNDMSLEDLRPVVIDTMTETILTVGAMSGPVSAAQHVQARRKMTDLVRGDQAAQEAAGAWLMEAGYLDPETGEPTAAGKRLFDKRVRKRDAAMVAGVKREGAALRNALARFAEGGEISGKMADTLLRHGWVDDQGAVTDRGQAQLQAADDVAPAAAVPESTEEKTAALLDLGYRQTDIDKMLEQAPSETEEIIATQRPKWSPEEGAEVTRQQAEVGGLDQEVMVIGQWHDGSPLAVDSQGEAYTLSQELEDAEEAQLEGREPAEITVANPLQEWHVDGPAIDRHVRQARRAGRITRAAPKPAAEPAGEQAAEAPAQVQSQQAVGRAMIVRPADTGDTAAITAAAERLGLTAEQQGDAVRVSPGPEAEPGAMDTMRQEVAGIAEVTEEAAPEPAAAPAAPEAEPAAPAEQPAAAPEAAEGQAEAAEAPAEAPGPVTQEEVTQAGAREAARKAKKDPDAIRIRRIGENPDTGYDRLTEIAVQGGIRSRPKGYRGGEYDGQPKLTGAYTSLMNPRGGLMPDQMAQVLHDKNMIAEPTADALWQAVEEDIALRASAREKIEEARQGPPPPEVVEPGPPVDERAEPLTEEEIQAPEDAWDDDLPFELGAATDRFKQGARISLAKIARMVGDQGMVRRETDGSISMVAPSGDRVNWVARRAPAAQPGARGALAATFQDEDGRTVAQVAIYPNAIDGTYGHEMVHALLRLGLITDAEYRHMVAEARRLGLDELLEQYREAYEDRGYTEAEMQTALDEELAAIYVEKLSADNPLVQPRWWQRLQRWFLEAGAAVGLYPTPDMTGWQTAEEIIAGGLFDRERQPGELEPDLEGMRWSLPEDGEAAPRQLDIFVDHMQTHLFDDQLMEERDQSLEQDAPDKDVRAHRLLADGLAIEMGPSDRISALAQDYYECRTPSFDVTGKTVASARDAATLFAMLRSPFVERLSWIVVDGSGKVTASQIQTIGSITGTDSAFDPVNARDLYAALRNAGDGATAWISHNHPAGNAEPSPEDRNSYARGKRLIEARGYQVGFVITNGDKFYAQPPGESTLEPYGYGKEIVADYEAVPFASLGMRIQSPEQAATTAEMVRRAPNASLALFVDTRLRVRAIETFTTATKQDLAEGLARHAASGILVVTVDYDFMTGLAEDRHNIPGLMDVIHVDNAGATKSAQRMLGNWQQGEAGIIREQQVPYVAESIDRAPDGTNLVYDDAQVDQVAERLIADEEWFAGGLETESGEDIRFSLPEDQSEQVAKRYPNPDPPNIEQWAQKHRIANLGRRGNKLTLSWVQRDGVHRVSINRNLVPAQFIEKLKQFNGTPFAAAAMRSLEARAAIHQAINPESARVTSSRMVLPRWLRDAIRSARVAAGNRPPTVKAAALKILDAMAASTTGIISNPAKPELAVPGSYINCTPTKECAWKCYATRNMRQSSNYPIIRSEAMDLVARKAPAELGRAIAGAFKSTNLYAEGFALRFYDRGEGHTHWLRVIEALNNDGVRVHVFSKNAAFVAKVPDTNVRMFSVDRDNWQAGKRSGLPLAFVWQDAKDADALKAVRNQVQCLLPIMRQQHAAAKDIDMARDILGTRAKVVCPVDAGERNLGADWHYQKDSKNHTCARCDKEGIGCYWKQATRKVWGQRMSPNERIAEIVRIVQEEGLSNAEAQEIARRISAEVLGWNNQTATGDDPGRDATDVSRQTRNRVARSRRQKKDGQNRRDDPDVEAWSLPDPTTHSANPRYFVTRTQQLIEDESMPDRASGDQMFRFLRNKGVNKREMFWLGLDTLENDENQWTRDQVQALVRETQPVFAATVLEDTKSLSDPRRHIYSEFMPGLYDSVEDYHEILVEMRGGYGPSIIAGGIYSDRHWSSRMQGYPVVYHIRAGFSRDRNTNRDVYYVGEIQSDWAQELQKRPPPLKRWPEGMQEVVEKIQQGGYLLTDMDAIGGFLVDHDVYEMAVAKADRVAEMRVPQEMKDDARAWAERMREERLRSLQKLYEELPAEDAEAIERSAKEVPGFILTMMDETQIRRMNQREGVPRETQPETDVPNPLQKTWVENALLRSLREAVYSEQDYLAWSAGPEIAEASQGSDSVLTSFYSGRVKNTAQKILNKIAPGQKVTEVDLGISVTTAHEERVLGAPALTPVDQPAIEITPKVRQAVLEGDVPLAYSLPERDVLQRRAPAQGMQRSINERLAAAADRSTALEADDAHFSLPENRRILDQLSSDPDANERIVTALSARPKEPGILQWLKDMLAQQWALIRNTWQRLDEAKFPVAIEELKLLQSRLESSVIRAWRIQDQWFGRLSQEQQVEFSLLVALPDLIRTLEDDQEGLYADKPGNIPFYGRGDEETRTVAQIRDQVVADYRAALNRSDPQVRRAIEERTDWHRGFVEQLVNYGLLNRDVLEDERYYHRIVLKYMDSRRIAGGKAGIRQRKVSAQRQRVGGGDFSLDYTLSETQYIAEMLGQMAKVDAWARLDAQHGIKGDLKKQAESLNYAAMQEIYFGDMEQQIQKAIADGAPREIVAEMRAEMDRGWDFEYRQKMAINFQYLLKLVATGDLRGTPFADFEDEVDQAYRAWQKALAEWQDIAREQPKETRPARPQLTVDHPSFWAFVHYIASGQHGPVVETTTMGGKPMENPRDVNPQLNALAIFKAMAEKERATKEALGTRYQTWRGLAYDAEGYSIIQPEKGLLFAPGFTIQESALTALITQTGQAVDEDVLSMLPDVVPVESRNIRRGRILVGPKPEFVWPEALVETIEDLDTWYRGLPNLNLSLEKFSRAWKVGILFGPWRWAKYETRNAFSDVDVALTNPGILREVPEAARDMARWSARSKAQAATGGALFGALLGTGVGFAFAGPIGAAAGLAGGSVGLGALLAHLYSSSTASQIEMERWEDYNVFNSGQLLNEVGQLDVERSRELVEGRRPNLVARYFSATKHFNLWREGVLRLAAARHMLGRLKLDGSGAIERRIYVASRRDVMDVLYDEQAKLAKAKDFDQSRQMVYQIAAKLSRELLGDYGSISERGRMLRRTLAPFWSWQEVNLPRYVRLFKNAPYEGRHRNGTNRRLGLATVSLAGRGVLRVGMGALAMTVMVRGWNAMMRQVFDIDDDEDPNQYGRGHFIIVGRDADGTIQAVSIAGALQDAAGWIGADNWAEHQRKIERADHRGEVWKGVKETAGDMAFAPVQRGADLVTPWIKVPAEQAARQQYFPDVRDPRALKDRWEHLFSAAGLKEPYMAWSRRASPEEIADTLTYDFNPGASAYWQAKGLAWDFQERQGLSSEGVFLPKEHTWCLSQAKSAWQMESPARTDYWLMRYFQAGGNLKKYAASKRAGHPLAPVAKKRRQMFWDELDERDRSYVRLGIAWWEEQGAGSPEFHLRVRRVYDEYLSRKQ